MRYAANGVNCAICTKTAQKVLYVICGKGLANNDIIWLESCWFCGIQGEFCRSGPYKAKIS